MTLSKPYLSVSHDQHFDMATVETVEAIDRSNAKAVLQKADKGLVLRTRSLPKLRFYDLERVDLFQVSMLLRVFHNSCR